jgi:hypothetical protein
MNKGSIATATAQGRISADVRANGSLAQFLAFALVCGGLLYLALRPVGRRPTGPPAH